MSHLEVPRFPHGFLLSDQPVAAPPTFIAGPLMPNFYVHPWTNLDVAGDHDAFVIVMGHAVPTWDTGEHHPSQNLLGALIRSPDEFFRELSRYSGRHAVLFGNSKAPKIVNDATGMRAVFYAGEGGIVSSHALLVERALGPVLRTDELPFQYGYPGNRTPHLRTKMLVPNTYYDITDNKVRRFWPTVEPPQRSVDDVAEECLEAATHAFRNISQGRIMNMALTAGLDSRVILAVGLNSGVDFKTYTYGDKHNTLLDRDFAAGLAEKHGVSHAVVPGAPMSDELSQSLDQATFATHHKSVVGALMDWYGDHNTVAVTGNLLEIGRSFYVSRRERGFQPPITPAKMRLLHYRTMGANVRDSIDRFGLERFNDISHLGFQSYIDDTQFRKTIGLLDAFDQFYWEHRMAAWHGAAMNERDFYGIAFIPFNSRAIFEAMLGVPRDDRDTSKVFYRMVEMVDPSLLDLPVNPKTWPVEV